MQSARRGSVFIGKTRIVRRTHRALAIPGAAATIPPLAGIAGVRLNPNPSRSMKSTLHPILCLALCLLAALVQQLRAEPAVTGTFTGDGKAAKIAHVSARKDEPLAGKDTIVLTFTEKDHTKEAKPDIKASFGNFGSALIITVNSDGEIVGCEVAHSAHKKTPFSSVGKIKLSDYKNAGGTVQGKISTGGGTETFGQKWEVDLTFHTKAP
jgi:allantoicase